MPSPKKSPGKSSSGNEPWTKHHTQLLALGIVELVTRNRNELYKLPGIFGVVDNHGNNRTRCHVESLLSNFGKVNGLSPNMFKPSKGVQMSGQGKKRKDIEQGSPSPSMSPSPTKIANREAVDVLED